MKRLLIALAVVTVLSLLVAQVGPLPVAAEEPLKVFYSNQQVGHPFWNIVTEGAEDAAERYGMELTMAGPTGMDNAAQIQMIDAAIATGEYDAMIIPAIVPEMFQPSIDAAVDAGITVVTFCTDAPESKRSAFVGTSGFGAGKTAGEALAELTGGKANINVISGQEAQPDLNERIVGFKEGIADYPDMEVTSIDYSGEEGLSKNVSDLQARLVSEPDIDAFFSSQAEGGMALSTVYPDFTDRLEGTHAVVFDDLPQTLDAIREGIVDATMVQRQYNWGFGAIYQVHRLMQAGLPPSADSTDTGVVVVTKDNVDTYAAETMDPQMWLDLEAQESAMAEEPLKVFYSNQQVGHPFWNVVTAGAEDAAERYGMELTMAGPTGMDNAAQVQMIDAAIATGEYDAMIIPAIVPEMFQPSIDAAVDAGITVVTFCTDAPESKRSAFVGTSGFGAGKSAGEALAELTGGKANINIISGQEAQPDLNERIDGFKAGIADYPDMEVTSIDYSGEEGLSKNVSDLQARLVSEPDMDAFFSSQAEGGMALSTVYPDFTDRLEGTHAVVFDDLPQTLDAIRDGIVDATMVQRQYNWGFGAIYQVHRLLQAGLPPSADSTDTGVVVVTKDNVDTYAAETMDPQMWLDLEAQESAAAEPLKVFYSNQQVGHPFWNVVTAGAEDAAERYGMELTMAGPTGMDNAAQVQMIDAAIATGEYDAMIIPAIVPDMFQSSIDAAVDAGITVVTFCTDAPESKRACFVGTSGFGAGKSAGEALAELTGGKANINVISGQEAQPDLNERIDGFKAGIADYPDMEVTSIDYSGEEGLSKNVSDLQARLVSEPDIDAFFSSQAEGGMALSTVYPDFTDRLEGTHAVVFDDLPQTLDAIRDGIVDATMVQRQYNWGFGAIYQVHRLLQAGLPCSADSIDTGVVVVTKDNVDTYAAETMDPQMWLDLEAEE